MRLIRRPIAWFTVVTFGLALTACGLDVGGVLDDDSGTADGGSLDGTNRADVPITPDGQSKDVTMTDTTPPPDAQVDSGSTDGGSDGGDGGVVPDGGDGGGDGGLDGGGDGGGDSGAGDDGGDGGSDGGTPDAGSDGGPDGGSDAGGGDAASSDAAGD